MAWPSPVRSKWLEALSKHGEAPHLMTRRCNCGSVVGQGPSRPPDDARLPSRKRKGWSEARIRRWQEEQAAARERPDAQRDADREFWTALFSHFHEALRLDEVSLLFHMFGGAITEESVVPICEQTIRYAAEGLLELLAGLEPDVLYRFRFKSAPPG